MAEQKNEEENEKMSVLKNFEEEIERLTYTNPTCDFQHIWNCAIDKALECFTGYDIEGDIDLSEMGEYEEENPEG